MSAAAPAGEACAESDDWETELEAVLARWAAERERARAEQLPGTMYRRGKPVDSEGKPLGRTRVVLAAALQKLLGRPIDPAYLRRNTGDCLQPRIDHGYYRWYYAHPLACQCDASVVDLGSLWPMEELVAHIRRGGGLAAGESGEIFPVITEEITGGIVPPRWTLDLLLAHLQSGVRLGTSESGEVFPLRADGTLIREPPRRRSRKSRS